MNRGLWMASVLAAISGCSSDSAEQVASSATSTLSLPSTIEPAALPDVGPAFIYKAAGLRDPFRSSAVELVPRPAVSRAQVQPDPTRGKHFLEGFALEQFEMVGTLSSAGASFVLLRGPGGVHRLKVGDYLGRNDGRVVAVGERHVEVIELVPEGEEGWLERSRILALKAHS